MSSRRIKTHFFEKKNGFCWKRVRVEQEDSTSEDVNSFLWTICQESEEIPNNLSRGKKFFSEIWEEIHSVLIFSVHVKIASNKKLYYKYLSKEIIIKLSLLKNSCYIRSYCISSNRVLPWGYSYKCRSSRIWAIPLNSCCSPTSLTATCLDGQQPP